MKINDIISNLRIKLSPKTGALYAYKLLQFELKKNQLEQNILYCKEKGISDKKYCDHDIIVSLTTYGKRIHDVHLTIESIMEQTLKANRIILWLDYSFTYQRLPQSLELLKERGLEIKFCEDLRSYKKLIPSLIECPNDAIITIDDDIIYNFDLIENLVFNYLADNRYIYCARYHKMKLDNKGKLLPYNQWQLMCESEEIDILNFPTGGAGTLYPPKSLDIEVLNKNVFMDICKYADDVWFKAMAIKNGTLSKKVYNKTYEGGSFISNESVQDIALWRINVEGESLNDKQIKAVFSKYDLYKLLENGK